MIFTNMDLYIRMYGLEILLSRIKRPANVRNCIGRVLGQIKKKKKKSKVKKKKKETCAPSPSPPLLPSLSLRTKWPWSSTRAITVYAIHPLLTLLNDPFWLSVGR